jgi:hypothetical protein
VNRRADVPDGGDPEAKSILNQQTVIS